ncbi:MAG TPA: D-glycero-beta-D-manno-heptose 1,7-bisphosphate 7-phosphatase [Blastocatellia bacterium]|nr:D-glycero-beta-D-manno-heptose 1,7-bisphosphate 7-phosphatase [Blastocatellia bacterium]
METSYNTQSSRPAVFLDRDGTVNEEVGYVCDPAQFRLYEYAAEAVRLVNQAGWLAIVVTSQAGIARGMFDEKFLAQIHQQMKTELADAGATIDAIYYCPHHPTVGEPPYRLECECRKPKPGMLRQAAEELNLDLTASVVIGDRFRDLAMAQAVGARSVLVLTGYGREEFENDSANWPQQPDYVAENLLEAVRWVINQASTKF